MDTVNKVLLSEYKKVDNLEDSSIFEKKKIKDLVKLNFNDNPRENSIIGSLQFPTACVSETPIFNAKTEGSFFKYIYESSSTAGKSGHLVVEVGDQWKDQVNLVKLAQLKVGDCFFLNINNQKKVYQIIKIETVRDQSYTIIPNTRLLTMVMNNLSGFTDNQSMIMSKEIPSESLKKDNIRSKLNFSYQVLVSIFLLLNVFIFGSLVLLYQKYIRKAYSKLCRIKYGGYRKLRGLLQVTRGYYILLGLVMIFFLLILIYRIST